VAAGQAATAGLGSRNIDFRNEKVPRREMNTDIFVWASIGFSVQLT